MKTQHTPGPWRSVNNYVVSIIEGGSKMHRVTIARCVYGSGPEERANARLIAAAPEMLHVLELIYSNAAESPEWIRARIQPVLAKATNPS